MKSWRIVATLFAFSFVFVLLTTPPRAEAATLKISPEVGVFTVGSTVEISLFVDTEGESINAFEIILRFPADKLQVVSAGTGPSIVGIWATQPKYNNQTGTIELRGGIPGGITTSRGFLASFTFRARQIGSAIIKPEDSSKILLNDGLATDVLHGSAGAILEFKLPPPLGPFVVSETHPDESRWYIGQDVILHWAPDDRAEGYSYVLNQDPISLPDDISEGVKSSVSYKSVSSGKNYFHIKALRGGVWGGVTHYGIKIDTEAPAPFPISILPSATTIQRQPIIEFGTTDGLSGVDRYEIKIVPLSSGSSQAKSSNQQRLFIEVESPYVAEPLELGAYDVIVRAFDKAGNFEELSQRLNVTTALLRIVQGKGIEFRQGFFIPWLILWIISALILVGLGFLGWRMRIWHHEVHDRHARRELPSEVQQQLEELKTYRKKYKGLAMLFLIVASSLFFGLEHAKAAEVIPFSPPLITSVSRNISNDEIFYIGGKIQLPSNNVIVYFQNLETGEVTSANATPDDKGNWFYRHDQFLPAGEYVLWAQGQKDEEMSPPSPQERMVVQKTAIQFGSSRLSYTSIYVVIIILMLLSVIGLVIYIITHGIKGRRKQKAFLEGLRRTEETLRREFAVLERDIQGELALIRRMKITKDFSEEEKRREAEMLRDIEAVRRFIGKEIWEIEEAKRHSDLV